MINVALNNGVKMPILGYGMYKITDEMQVITCVHNALDIGYRKIDTATLYNNEEYIGKAINNCGIPREELFITSKLWTNIISYDDTMKSTEIMLNNLKTNYIDLLLIHWPVANNLIVWDAMVKLYKQGIIRSIGTSNFKEHHLQRIIHNNNIIPAVNQVELHPLFQQKDLRAYCKSNSIQVEAWSPLMRGKALDLAELEAIAYKYNKSISQIILRYDIQQGISVVPKSANKERMRENFELFDFELLNDDVELIANIDKNERQYRDPDNHMY